MYFYKYLSNNLNEILNYIINISICFAIIYMIYNFYDEYKKEEEFNKKFITEPENLDENIKNNLYDNSQLVEIYNNLSDNDKRFLNDFINHARITQKTEKTKYNKLKNTFKEQFLINTFITILFQRNIGSIINSFKQNTLQQFSSSLI